MGDETHGALLSIATRTMGDQLDTAASSGATTLSLEDVSDFDEENGGFVAVNGTTYAYNSVDMVADTIHLTTGLTATAAVGDRVDIWDGDTGVVVSELTALVMVDGQDGDPIAAAVDHSLTPLLAAATLAAGQSVSIAKDGAGHRLTEVHAKNNQILNRSSAAGIQMGIDQADGTVTGVTVTSAGSVFLGTLISARVTSPDGVTFKPILASAFTVSSDAALKTKPTAAPDALAIIKAAPAKHWRYKTDGRDVKRIGPMAGDLPDWLAQVDETDGTLGLDLARQSGLHHRAIEQLIELVDDLKAEIAELKKER